MVVPSKAPKPKVTILNKKLYYLGNALAWSGLVPLLLSTYAHFKFFEKGSFTPEIFLNKALLIGGLIATVTGIFLLNSSRVITGSRYPEPPFIIRMNSTKSSRDSADDP